MPHITVTLFTGLTGWALALLALLGASVIVGAVHEWLADRLTFEGFRLRRRWNRPGAVVTLPGGGEGAILAVYRDIGPDDADAIALVQTWDEDENYSGQQWVPVQGLVAA